MMKVLNDFRCGDCGGVSEHYLSSDTKTVGCPKCNGPAKRIIRPVRCNLDPISGDFPGATMKWHSNRDVKMRSETSDSAFCSEQGTIVRDNPSDYGPQL